MFIISPGIKLLIFSKSVYIYFNIARLNIN